jgi:hypothetical protein
MSESPSMTVLGVQSDKIGLHVDIVTHIEKGLKSLLRRGFCLKFLPTVLTTALPRQ